MCYHGRVRRLVDVLLMRALLLAIVACLAVNAPLLGEEPPPGGTRVSDYLSGKLPPIESRSVDPAADPTRFVEEPPLDIPFVPWSDWVVNQRVSPIRRVFLETSLGNLAPVGGSLTVSGEVFAYKGSFGGGDAPSFGLEAGYQFAPFLSVSLNYFAAKFSSSPVTRDISGTTYTLSPGRWAVSGILLTARLRLPFVLIGPRLFRFSRAPMSWGVVPFFRFGLGGASVGTVGGTYKNHTSGVVTSTTFFRNTLGPGLTLGGGVAWRWSWGVVSLEGMYMLLPVPTRGWSAITSTGTLYAGGISFSTGIYF